MLLTVAAIWAYQQANQTPSHDKKWIPRLIHQRQELLKELQEVRQRAAATIGCASEEAVRAQVDDMDHATLGPQAKEPLTFRQDTRAEWIAAVFGDDWLTQNHGRGLKGSYSAYSVTLPQCQKVGITLHRLALGLYVREVTPGSEAHVAGVLPHSVLVAINDVCLLAEPSKSALERLWQYESQLQEPLKLTLVKDRHPYSVLLLSNPPYGMTWAPCGNFALVQRAYSFGEEAGVQKGSIIASINESIDLQQLDHLLAAQELRRSSQESLRVRLVFPPSEARAGHWERRQQAQQTSDAASVSTHSTLLSPKPSPPRRARVAAEHDGVQVRVHKFSWTLPPPAKTAGSQLAYQVAAGEDVSIPKRPPIQTDYPSPPPLETLVEDDWSKDTAMLYIWKLKQVKHDERLLEYNSGETSRAWLDEASLQLIADSLLWVLATFGDTLKPTKDHSLDFRMELLAQAMDLSTLKHQLVLQRNQFAVPKETRESAPEDVPIEPVVPPASKSKKSKRRRLFRKNKESSKAQVTPPKTALPTPIPKPQMTPHELFSNTLFFLEELDSISETIQSSLVKTLSQKVTRWAWSPSQEQALSRATETLEDALDQCSSWPLWDPLGGSALDQPIRGTILPSAHVPLLLEFSKREVEQVTETTVEFDFDSPVRASIGGKILEWR